MNRRALASAVATLLVCGLSTGPAWALPEDEDRGGGAPTPLEQAREESGVQDAPRTRHDLPAGVLRLSASELLAASDQSLELSVTLERDVAQGSLTVTLPRQWTGVSGVSGLRFARLPVTGRGSSRRSSARRSDRSVTFAFDAAREGDVATFELDDAGIPAGTYELPYRWTGAGASARARGTLEVVFYAPVREEAEDTIDTDWRSLMRDVNATNDAVTQSETFLTAGPANRLRYIVGANGGATYDSWITNTGTAPFTKASMSPSLDAPGEAAPEPGALCCDPMSAADASGNLWYGGLSFANGAGNPSRIVVTRAAGPSGLTFGPTVGLKVRTAGTQDKPLMTIDNAPSSPAFGRLYVVWDEPSGGGINLVIVQCDTRPGGVLNAANCDDADNWTAPVNVTPATGSFIYADVATGPDGGVYVVWWDYSAANAIRGDSCAPATQNCATAAAWSTGAPQTIATLDATGGAPLPFACPIVAQPGGRASTSPQVDVDRSGGPDNGRVYVTWSDLRTGSGTTRCSSTPATTHLTFDSFVASSAGALPGGAGPSPTVATRLLTDGEGGGQANSDDWFAWLAVDQTTGTAWADFYSTRDDSTRKTTNFYVRSVVPNASGHLLGPLRKASTAPSDYSANTCCTFGNDYGDYSGIDAAQGVTLPVWSSKQVGFDGEAFIDVLANPALAGAGQVFDDSPAAGGDADGVLEKGESFRLTRSLTNSGPATATAVSATLTAPAGSAITFTQPTSTYPDILTGATQPQTTQYAGSLAAAASCGSTITMALQVVTAADATIVPVTVPSSCPPSPPPPPIAVPPPPPPPPPPAISSADQGIVFALTGMTTQKPLVKKSGVAVALSCPLETCRVSLNGVVTLPATTARGKAKKVSLKSAAVIVAKGSKVNRRFTISAGLRSRLQRALRSARTRRKVTVLITATATDAAGNRATRTLEVKLRR